MVNESKRVSVFDRLAQSSTFATRDRKNRTTKPITPLASKSNVVQKVFGVRKVETKSTRTRTPRTRTPTQTATKPVKVAPKIKPDRVVRKKPVTRIANRTNQPRVRKVEQKAVAQPRITKSNGPRKAITPKAKNKSMPQKANDKRGKMTKKDGSNQDLPMSMRGLTLGPKYVSEASSGALLNFDDDDMSVDDEEVEELTGVSESIQGETPSIPQENKNEKEDVAESVEGVSFGTDVPERPTLGKEVSDLTEPSALGETTRTSALTVNPDIVTVTEEEPTEPESTEPETTEPETTEPETTELESAKPETTQPETTQPESIEPEPEPTEPKTTDLEPTDPEPTETEPTETETTELESAKPEPTQLELTQPESTEPEPEPTEPKTTDVEPTEPEPTETETTEPENTELEPTQLQTTEPKPSQPEPSQPEPNVQE